MMSSRISLLAVVALVATAACAPVWAQPKGYEAKMSHPAFSEGDEEYEVIDADTTLAAVQAALRRSERDLNTDVLSVKADTHSNTEAIGELTKLVENVSKNADRASKKAQTATEEVSSAKGRGGWAIFIALLALVLALLAFRNGRGLGQGFATLAPLGVR